MGGQVGEWMGELLGGWVVKWVDLMDELVNE